jgi:hypothetical protein
MAARSTTQCARTVISVIKKRTAGSNGDCASRHPQIAQHPVEGAYVVRYAPPGRGNSIQRVARIVTSST